MMNLDIFVYFLSHYFVQTYDFNDLENLGYQFRYGSHKYNNNEQNNKLLKEFEEKI